MTKISIEIDEQQLKKLVIEYINNILDVPIGMEDVHIEAKSAQNYKSEWERAHFRARVERNR